MVKIGLTGGIATGKTTVARMFAELGAATVDADAVYHEMLANDAVLVGRIAAAFGRQYVRADGLLERAALARLVFEDGEALRRLNAITHPALLKEVERRLAGIQGAARAVVLEAAVLFEMGADRLCDVVVATVARPETQVGRLMAKGLGEDEAWARVRAQRWDWRARAGCAIDTEASLPEVRRQVAEVWRRVVGAEA